MGTNYEIILIGYGVMIVLCWIIWACITGALASKKGKNVAYWVCLSFFIGLLAVIILAFSPSQTQPTPNYNRQNNRQRFKSLSQNYTPSKFKLCEKCGNTLTTSICDMCGFKNIENGNTDSNIPKKPISIPKTEKYQCANCGEVIDTVQCPWCGVRRKN